MRLTRRNFISHRQLRRRFASDTAVGPTWTVLASEILVAACRLAGVDARDILLRMHSRYRWPELRKDQLFGKLSQQLPSCEYVRLQSGILHTYCEGAPHSIGYSEDKGLPQVMLFGMKLSETVLGAVRGRRLSELVDLSKLPALGHVNPVIRKASNMFDPAGHGDLRVDVRLQVEWRTVDLMPDELGLRHGLFQNDSLVLPSDRSKSGY